MSQKKDIISAFEDSLLLGLKKCSIDLDSAHNKPLKLGAAVSGGADSISLLYALTALCAKRSIPLKVITVNHFIRSEEESCADANYVIESCKQLKKEGFDVSVELTELKKGAVAALAEERGIGIEAAARDLRYKAFDSFIEKHSLSCLCLAHNQNDQCETILMKFLQGAGGSSFGIPSVRDKYIRPLLWTSRSQIEAYLKARKIDWCTDKSNADTKYLRNRIRHKLLPLLDKEFPGWEHSVLNGSEKAAEDSALIQAMAEQSFKALSGIEVEKASGKEEIFFSKDFYSIKRALQNRLLIMAANALDCKLRIPYVFLRDTCDCADNYRDGLTEKKGGGEAVKNFADLQILLKKDGLLIKKRPLLQNEIAFSVIIEDKGMYEFPWGQVNLPADWNYPVLLRSWRMDDSIMAADGSQRKVKDILSSWKVLESVRQYIPVVQTLAEPDQKLIALLGSCQGYKDWIVKNEEM